MCYRRIALLLFVCCAAAWPVIIDRVAIVVGNSIIKDSDIDRDVRVTDFLNREPLALSAAARKKAANRLIDQVFIRREIRIGDYPVATMQEAEKDIDNLKQQRYGSATAFEQALQRYGLTEDALRLQLQWQLTVLRFIDARFRPAVLVTDDEIEKYYHEHAAALQRQYPGKSLDNLRATILQILQGERVNTQFFSWLDEQRKNSNIQFREESLA